MNRQHVWRKNHIKYRNKSRKSNYDKSKVKRDNRHWEYNEIFALMFPLVDENGKKIYTDRQLGKLLKRSVQAIQMKRYKIRRDHGSRHHAKDSN